MSTDLTPDELGPPDLDNPVFSQDVYRRTWGAKAAAEAKRLTDQDNWGGFEAQGSLAEQIANPEPQIGWCVEQLIPECGTVQINAQWKVGKSTLASVNLARSLVTKSAFLRRFPTHLEDHEHIAIWNLEVDRQTLNDWLAKSDLADDAAKRIHPLTLRGKRIDFTNPTVAEDTVRWLRERNVAVWIIDPLSKLYLGDENSNSEFNNWWAAMQDIANRAGVRVVVVVHHTGHGGTRARGASAMMGAPDVLLTYRHGGDPGELPPDNRRWLRAFGRNVDVPEFEISFAPTTLELYADERGEARTDAQADRVARTARNAIEKAGRALNTGELTAACGWPKKGSGYQSRIKAVRDAVARQWLTSEKDGRATLYALGPVTPEPMKAKPLTLVPSDSEPTNGATA